MNLYQGIIYQVVSTHPFHANRFGRFQFFGGPDLDVIVLADINNPQELFCVGLNDLQDFNFVTDRIIYSSILSTESELPPRPESRFYDQDCQRAIEVLRKFVHQWSMGEQNFAMMLLWENTVWYSESQSIGSEQTDALTNYQDLICLLEQYGLPYGIELYYHDHHQSGLEIID